MESEEGGRTCDPPTPAHVLLRQSCLVAEGGAEPPALAWSQKSFAATADLANILSLTWFGITCWQVTKLSPQTTAVDFQPLFLFLKKRRGK